MKEIMSTTAIDPMKAREYANGELSFDDIAEQRGRRELSTLDARTYSEVTDIIRKRNRAHRKGEDDA